MSKLPLSLLVLAIATMANAQYPLVFNYSVYQNPCLTASEPYQNVFPVDLAPVGRAFESVYATDPVTGAVSGGYVGVGYNVTPPIVAWGEGPIAGFKPADLIDNVSFQQSIFGPHDFRSIGAMQTSQGTKIAYYRGGFLSPFAQDYLYPANSASNDTPLKLGEYPYGDYAAVSLGTGTGSELAVLCDTHSTVGPNPRLEFTAPEMSPTTAYFSGATFLVEGKDNEPDTELGGCRVAAYKINVGGRLSRDYSLRFENNQSGTWTTNHSVCVGSNSDDFTVVADNETIHNSVDDTTKVIYTLYAYDGAGRMLWHSAEQEGVVTAVSVGTASNIYVLASQVPGEYLYQYDSTGGIGSPKWFVKGSLSKISAAADQGVVYALDNPDANGHRHATVVILDANANELQTFTYSTEASNDDIVTSLLWTTDGQYYYVYLVGRYVQPNGQDGIFGAMWDTWGAIYP